jgi:tetratricopeptide (TPR) repeat protein
VAARSALALAPLVLARGPLGSFVTDLGRVVETRGTPAYLRAELHFVRGLAVVFAGRRDEALADFRRAHDLAKGKESQRIRALSASKMGLVLGMKGRLSEAHEAFDEAKRLAKEPRDRGIVLKDHANVLSEEGKNEEAAALLSRARGLFHAAGDSREEGFVAMMLGTRLLDDGELTGAERDCTAALALLRRAGDRRSEAWTLAMLALVDTEQGDPSSARARLDAALELARGVGDEHTEGLLLSFVGNVALEHGPLDDAEAAYRDAATLLERAGDRGSAGLVAACAAVLDRELGRAAAAREGFRHAEELLEGDGRAARRAAVDILRDLAAPESESHAVEEIRFARRIVAAISARRGSRGTKTSDTVVVANDGTWVRLTDGHVVRLARSRALAAVVQRLALEHARHPGRPVAPSALVRAAWPDERILPAAARNRLHVTIARLRRLGLGTLIVHDPEGYLFDTTRGLRVALPGERFEDKR